MAHLSKTVVVLAAIIMLAGCASPQKPDPCDMLTGAEVTQSVLVAEYGVGTYWVDCATGGIQQVSPSTHGVQTKRRFPDAESQ